MDIICNSGRTKRIIVPKFAITVDDPNLDNYEVVRINFKYGLIKDKQKNEDGTYDIILQPCQIEYGDLRDNYNNDAVFMFKDDLSLEIEKILSK